MQHCDTSVRTNEDLENPCREGATQALEQILSCGLPILYRQAYRLLSDAEDAVHDALLAAYMRRYQFNGQSQMSRAAVPLALLNFVEMLITVLPTHEKIGIGTAFATAD